MWDKIKTVFALIGAIAVVVVLYLLGRRATGNGYRTIGGVGGDLDTIGNSTEGIRDGVERATEATDRAIDATGRGDPALDEAIGRVADLIRRVREDGISGD